MEVTNRLMIEEIEAKANSYHAMFNGSDVWLKQFAETMRENERLQEYKKLYESEWEPIRDFIQNNSDVIGARAGLNIRMQLLNFLKGLSNKDSGERNEG